MTTIVRGYLKSPGHTYSLRDNVTSIGKRSHESNLEPVGLNNVHTHVPLDYDTVESVHALIEQASSGVFTLTDLNTVYGTFVNGYRIYNETITLTPGDKLMFGKGNVPFDFVTTESKVNSNEGAAVKRATGWGEKKINRANNDTVLSHNQTEMVDYEFNLDKENSNAVTDGPERDENTAEEDPTDIFANALLELKGDNVTMANEREEW